MPDAFACPGCGYKLDGLGDEVRVRCPECGRTYSWRGLSYWVQEGRFLPPTLPGKLLLATPGVCLLAGFAGTVLGKGGPWAGGLSGWIWATACLAVLFQRAMRKHGGAFAGAMTVVIAPLFGAVVVAFSMLLLAILAASLR